LLDLEHADSLPLTLRQIFYRLVGVNGHAKTEQAYQRLGEHVNRARRSGLIPFPAITDRLNQAPYKAVLEREHRIRECLIEKLQLLLDDNDNAEGAP
jgi:hypothetical protein